MKRFTAQLVHGSCGDAFRVDGKGSDDRSSLKKLCNSWTVDARLCLINTTKSLICRQRLEFLGKH
jgi:hypothetical protein